MGGLLGGAGLLSGIYETGSQIAHGVGHAASGVLGHAAPFVSLAAGASHMMDGHAGIGDRVVGALEAFSGGVGSLGILGSAATGAGATGAGAAMSGAAAAAAPAAAVAGAGAAGWGLGRALDNGVGWASRQMGGDGRNLSDRIGDGLFNTLGAGPGLWLADHLPSWMQ